MGTGTLFRRGRLLPHVHGTDACPHLHFGAAGTGDGTSASGGTSEMNLYVTAIVYGAQLKH
jgi:hypothetical protein